MKSRVTMHTRSGKTIRYRAKETRATLRGGRIVEWHSDGIGRTTRLLTISPDDLESIVVRPWWRIR